MGKPKGAGGIGGAPDAKGRKANPEETANFFSLITFGYLTPLIQLGSKRPLNQEDLYELCSWDQAEGLSERFDKCYDEVHEKRVAKDAGMDKTEHDSGKRNGSILFSAIWAAFGRQFIKAGCVKFVHDLFQLMPPLMLNGVLRYMQGVQSGVFYDIFGKEYGWYCAAGMFVIPFCKSVLEGQYFNMMFRLGVQLKAGLVSHVYGKSMRLSNQGRKAQSVGDIITLMQVDTQRLFDTAPFLHTVWSGAFQIFTNIGILIYYLGPSALAGVFVMIITVPLQAKIGRQMMKLTRVVLKATGERTKTVNEALQGMKVVKAYAWEGPTRDNINRVRTKETDAMRRKFILRAVQSMIMMASPNVIMLATFLVYAGLADGTMDPATVFTAVALFNALRAPLMMYPFVLNALLAGKVSLERIGKFFGVAGSAEPRKYMEPADKMVDVKGSFKWAVPPEAPKKPDPKAAPSGKGGKAGPAASSSKAVDGKGNDAGSSVPGESVSKKETFEIKDVDISVRKGQMLAVVGPVASGKSSLVGAMLGEMDQTSGSPCVLRGKVAYVAQQPWIMNSTLRENILFGREMNEERYSTVLDACALSHDLLQLPGGDMTEIGERGINLSGGQKARVSLARACYSEADVYIFDDPLSAVDAHVGKHLFEQCISGLLRGSTRVLVTNQLTCVPFCDEIAVIDKGTLVEFGTYEKLMADKHLFSKLMHKSGAASAKQLQDATPAAVPGVVPAGGEKPKKKFEGMATVKRGPSDETKKKEGALVARETMARGQIHKSIVYKYATMAGPLWPLFIVLVYIVVQGSDALTRLWLSFWTQDKFDQSLVFYMGYYALIAVIGTLLVFVRTLIIAIAGLIIARALHRQLTHSVLRAPMSFFDTTPAGRILNRFSSDMATIDEQLPFQWSMFLNLCFMVMSTFVIITIITPWWAAVFAPTIMLYMWVQNLYRKTARELKRLDSVSRSPVYQQFTETLNGLSTIRAYGHEDRFARQSFANLDANNMAFFCLKSCDRWLSLRLDLMGNLLVCSAALLALVQKDSLYAGLAGVSIDYALQITFGLSFLVRNATELENQLNAVERVLEYADGLVEEAPTVIEGSRPPAGWPSKGEVDFQAVTMRYREGLDLVLKGVTLSVKPGEKVGVVGRTGAGKSSLMLTLFRLVEPAGGKIIVDGVDIATLGLDDLRGRLAIIPQDPVLFSGTVRSNLDPFAKYTDVQLWRALDRAHLKQKVADRDNGLDAEVQEFGENFSVGERQLLCMARVLLREAKVMVMDEATSSVDFETDSLIQRTIREDLGDTTLLIIAHRIHTVIDADKILVMDAGVASEYDTPAALLEDEKGDFARLVENTGEESAAHLKKIARGEESFFAAFEAVRAQSLDQERRASLEIKFDDDVKKD